MTAAGGDQFQVLVESDMIDGETLDSRVLAVKYDGERMDLTVVRNTTDDNFYTPEGSSLDPAFARHPFEGNYRLSSNFNPRRLHPVTGRVSPHNGTDFAMPIGTPHHCACEWSRRACRQPPRCRSLHRRAP